MSTFLAILSKFESLVGWGGVGVGVVLMEYIVSPISIFSLLILFGGAAAPPAP